MMRLTGSPSAIQTFSHLKFVAYRGNQNPFEQSLRREAVEIATVLIEIVFLVCEVRLTLLQKRLGIPKLKPEKSSDLLTRERALSIALQRSGERAARDVGPGGLQTLRDVLRACCEIAASRRIASPTR
jgi:hypothetical protein